MRTLSIVVLLALAGAAHAEDQDDDEVNVLRQDCALKGLKAGKLVVDTGGVTISDGKRKVAAMTDDDFGAFNKAKADVTCKETAISVMWQMPFSAAFYSFDLKLVKKKLVVVKHEAGDPSADKLEKANKLLAEHKIKEAIDELTDMEYPSHYVSDDFGKSVVKAAWEQAETLHKAKQDKEAADVLGAAFQYYDDDFGGGDDAVDKAMVLYRNEWGFFLASSGQNAAAEPVLRDVLKADPARKVAHLNLADVLWALGKKDEAAKEYQSYATATPAAKWPPQVAQRCPACKKKP